MRAAEVEGWGMEGGRDEKKGAMPGKREEGEKGLVGCRWGGGRNLGEKRTCCLHGCGSCLG